MRFIIASKVAHVPYADDGRNFLDPQNRVLEKFPCTFQLHEFLILSDRHSSFLLEKMAETRNREIENCSDAGRFHRLALLHQPKSSQYARVGCCDVRGNVKLDS